ncbi:MULTISPECIES: hypothetical protein [Paenibacillus]|uniref:Uncharacterized protein n=2 Tax=Paenibacillus TaxID=44249 RepID=A0AAP5H4Y2_PAEAM|nr:MULTISPECIES: hypothetical protein [Paenibacillus]MCG7377908.1 hypothetical protein [Paenibacillus sp. ACRSA]MDQ0172801.1 hypothetical protein [Paenibacillus tundrae]MDR6725937.1 hypothetical protein [Paenibacillus amylolyticus]
MAKKPKHAKHVNRVEVDKSRLKFNARQSAKASVGQGGNAFAINANELGNIRVRAGQQ